MTEFEIAAEFDRCHAITGHGPAVPNRIADPCDPWVLANRISVLEHRLASMTQERDYAVLRMEAAIATSHGFIEELVERRIRDATNAGVGMTPLGTVVHGPAVPFVDYPTAHTFPANALRHQFQPIGLLSTADAGRVRLGGYAPTLPCPTPRRCPNE